MFEFDYQKAMQAAGVLLGLEPKRCMGRIRLLKLLYMARGSYVGALTPNVHIWDVAAGLPVAWETGCVAHEMDGTPYERMDVDPAGGYSVPPLIVTTPEMYPRVRSMVTLKA